MPQADTTIYIVNLSSIVVILVLFSFGLFLGLHNQIQNAVLTKKSYFIFRKYHIGLYA